MIYRKIIKIDSSIAINKLIKKIKAIEGVKQVKLNNDEIIVDAEFVIDDKFVNELFIEKNEDYKEEIFYFDNIDCPNCASKVEYALNRNSKIKEAKVIFLSKKIIIKHNEKDIFELVENIVKSLEKDTNVFRDNINKEEPVLDNGNENRRVFSKKLVFILGVILFFIAAIFSVFGNEELLELINLKPLIDGYAYLVPLFVLYLLSYIFLAYDLIYKSIYGLFHKDYFNESLLMVIASIGAIILSFIGDIELFEACAVVLLYKIGESLQDKATESSKKEILGLMNLNVDQVTLLSGENVKVNDVNIGDKILIKVGEKIPLDGKIIEGYSSLDMKLLTGESEPVFVHEGEDVLSGSINLSNVLIIEVTKNNSESTISKVMKIIEEANQKKSNSEQFITKFARIYTPIILIISIAVLIIQLLLKIDIQDALNSVFAILVISCPCSLVISIPLAYFASIGVSSRRGILVKGGNYLEALTNIESVVFDKTGTLTEGEFEVVSVNPNGISKDELLNITSMIEYYSNHPIAKSIVNYYGYIEIFKDSIIEEIPGMGLKMMNGEDVYLVGNRRLLNKFNIEIKTEDVVGSVVYVFKNKCYLGNIVLQDKIKDNSKNVINYLNKINIDTVMLTGDKKEFGEHVANELKIKKLNVELLPQDKYQIIDNMVENKKKNIVYVGDGINDTPSLKRADIGITFGGKGADLAKEVSDIVIMGNDIGKVEEIINISLFTKKIIIQNLIFILFTKIAAVIISITGILNSYAMLIAIFADVGVCLLCILNSLRVLNKKNINK